AGGVRADSLEDILNGDVFAVVLSRGDGAAIENKARQVHARQGHGGRWDGLVATDDADGGVEELSAADELDGIGDYFAAHQRCLHAFGAHGLAIGNGDGVELHGRAAGGADSLFHL